jgi:glutamyl-tRNA reductase
VRALSRRFQSIVIANRDRARAEAVAATAGARAIALADVAANLDHVDAIVSAADTRGAVLSRETLAPRAARKPLVLVDIAVPRSVGAEARAVPGLIYRTVDDLDGSVALSQVETERMRAACVHAAEEFAREITARAAARAIRDLRLRAEDVRARQLARALRRLGHLNERDRRVVETLATGVMNAILHEPTVALRRSPERSADAIALFGAEAAGR